MFEIVLFFVAWGSWRFNCCFLEGSLCIWYHHHWLPWQSRRTYLVISWTRTWNSIDRFASRHNLVIWPLCFAYWISWLFINCALSTSVVIKWGRKCCHFKDVSGTSCSISYCRSRLLYKTKLWRNSVCTRTRIAILYMGRYWSWWTIEAPSWRTGAI